MVVTLDLESQAMTAAEINHTGVLSGTDQDARPFCGKTAQKRPGIAIAAMFGPHHAEHSQFRPVGITPEATLNLGVILLRQPFLTEGGGDIKGSIR